MSVAPPDPTFPGKSDPPHTPGAVMADATPPSDPQARKAAIREQARKNRVAQKNKDEVSRHICAAFTALPAYRSARTVMWYVDAGSEVRTRHTLPEALTHGKRVALAFDCQIFDGIPVAPHDVFMDLVLTETRAIRGIGRPSEPDA